MSKKTLLTLKWGQAVLFTSAIFMLGYWVSVIAETWMFQHRAMQQLEHSIHVPDGLVGRMDILRVGISVVVEGTGNPELLRPTGSAPKWFIVQAERVT